MFKLAEPDEIDSMVLKKLTEITSELLMSIIEHFWSTKQVTEDQKRANILPNFPSGKGGMRELWISQPNINL